MMDFTKGYASRWRVDRVDPGTWEPCGTLGGVESVTVDRDGTGDLLETATMKVTAPALESFAPGWHRITMEAVQGTHSESVPIATLWLDAGSGYFDKGYRQDAVTGRSALCQAADTQSGDGTYAPKGADGAAWVGDALSKCCDAPVNVHGGFELQEHIVYDLGASVLEAAWSVLRPYNWCLQIDGRGEIHVREMPSQPVLVLDRAGSCIMHPKVTYRDGAVSYSREWAPDAYPSSVVKGALPDRGLDGLYRIVTQKLTCAKGIKVEESAEAL